MLKLDRIMSAAAEPLDSAYSLPFEVYTDPNIFDAEKKQIFSKEWVFVCMTGELAEAGDYFAMTLANEPIVVIRGEDLQLRAFSNICRHRGTLLLDEGFGKVDKYITCPYHAWAYDRAGALRAIPYNKIIAVDREAHQLIQFNLDIWNGLVFVNLDAKAPPLAERLSGIDDYLHLFQPGSFDQVQSGEIEIWQSNWKLAMENAMESYHLFKVHESTLEVVSPTSDAYYIAGSCEWSLTGGATNMGTGSNQSDLYSHYILVQIAPSFVGVLSYGSFGWLSAHPIDAQTTQIRSGAIYGGERSAGRSDEFTKAFFQEDQDICERVQKGMGSKLSRGGKLVDMERVVVDFHQFLASRLGNKQPSPLFEDDSARLWKTGKGSIG